MIINKDQYRCPQCKKFYWFETSKEYDAFCPDCQCGLTFCANYDCDTELAEQRKNAPKYDPTEDPNSPFYIPVIQCPYCSSTKTSKISAMSRVVSIGIFGAGSKKIGKQFHCQKCGADF